MLYSEIYGVIGGGVMFLILIILPLIFNPLRESNPNKKEIFLVIATFICGLSLLFYSTTLPDPTDFCQENGYDNSGVDGNDYFCSKIENGSKIKYYYDEYELKAWEKKHLNKED